MKEEVTEVFVNSKDTMAERNKLEAATVCTAEHGTAERWIATMDHFIHVFNNRGAWM